MKNTIWASISFIFSLATLQMVCVLWQSSIYKNADWLMTRDAHNWLSFVHYNETLQTERISNVKAFPCHEVIMWTNIAIYTFENVIYCSSKSAHDDVIKWKHFPRYWLFVWIIHRSPVNSPHKGQWRGAFMFSLICVWIKGWVNNREAGDVRCYCAHYNVTVMKSCHLKGISYTTR